MSTQQLFQQNQQMQFWNDSQQNTLNTNFQNLQYTQPSQNSHTETNEVPETPTSPPKKPKRIKRKAKKKQRTPNQSPMMKIMKKAPLHVGNQMKNNYLQRVGWQLARTHLLVVPKPKVRFGNGFKMSSIKTIFRNTAKIWYKESGERWTAIAQNSTRVLDVRNGIKKVGKMRWIPKYGRKFFIVMSTNRCRLIMMRLGVFCVVIKNGTHRNWLI